MGRFWGKGKWCSNYNLKNTIVLKIKEFITEKREDTDFMLSGNMEQC